MPIIEFFCYIVYGRMSATKFVQHNKRRYPLKGISFYSYIGRVKLAIALQDFMKQL